MIVECLKKYGRAVNTAAPKLDQQIIDLGGGSFSMDGKRIAFLCGPCSRSFKSRDSIERRLHRELRRRRETE